MRSRDTAAVAACRGALSALDNAGAVPLDDRHRAGAIELSAVGPGAADVARAGLSEAESRAIVRREADDADEAAASLPADHATVAELRRRARLLRDLLDG